MTHILEESGVERLALEEFHRKSLIDPEVEKEFKRRKDLKGQKVRQSDKARGKRLKGRPEIFPLADEEAEYSETTEEYSSAVENIADSLGIWMAEADYAINKLGPIVSLIGLAYSMHQHREIPFTRAVDEVADNEYTVEDIQKFERARELTDYRLGSAIDLLTGEGYKKTEETPLETTGINLGSLLLSTPELVTPEVIDMLLPDTERSEHEVLFSELPKRERSVIGKALYGHGGQPMDLHPDDRKSLYEHAADSA